jgi:DNA processing protein
MQVPTICHHSRPAHCNFCNTVAVAMGRVGRCARNRGPFLVYVGWHAGCRRCKRPVTQTGRSLPPPSVETAVGLSLVGLGSHTQVPRAIRLIRSLPAAAVAFPGLPGCGDPWFDAVFAVLRLPPDKWRPVRTDAVARATQALAEAAGAGLSTLTVFEPQYPHLLSHIPDPPTVLWARGDLSALSAPTVAVVGSRNATAAGLQNASRLGKDLAAAGLVVASGLARGIDAAAHRGALSAQGVTTAVLGCGLDRVYPREHEELAASVARQGGILVSEYPPGTPPLPRHFPLRNRIISGLSRAVVIVEASERSGSLITARAALEQGRDVLAVPGGVVSGCYRGCHALIKDGARLVETVDDVLDEIGWRRGSAKGAAEPDKPVKSSDLLESMPVGEPVTIDQLAADSGRSASELLAELGAAELAGRISRISGGFFVRLD